MILGIGTDIVELERIRHTLDRQPRFLERILTEGERRIAEGLPQQRQIEFIAGRFAAKEALAKALGTGIGKALSWQDINIMKHDSGAPSVEINHLQADKYKVHLSISHSKAYAIAFAMIEQHDS